MADNYKFSQDYELIPPQKQRSYPISTTEWSLIKKKILDVKDGANFWHTLGSILIGAAVSTLITALTNDFKTPKLLWICWAAFCITGITGALSFYFGKAQRATQNKSKEDVIDFMGIIEERFQNVVHQPNQTTTSNSVVVLSATYLWPTGQVDVTEKIKSLVSKGITKIIVDPSTFEIPDPAQGVVKTLKLHCSINGQEKEFSNKDGDRFKIE